MLYETGLHNSHHESPCLIATHVQHEHIHDTLEYGFLGQVRDNGMAIDYSWLESTRCWQAYQEDEATRLKKRGAVVGLVQDSKLQEEWKAQGRDLRKRITQQGREAGALLRASTRTYCTVYCVRGVLECRRTQCTQAYSTFGTAYVFNRLLPLQWQIKSSTPCQIFQQPPYQNINLGTDDILISRFYCISKYPSYLYNCK